MMHRHGSSMAMLVVLATLPAGAQTLQQKGYEAVEQRVGDVDLLQRSQRRVESGLYEYGQGSSVFRGPGGRAGERRLYFITQGFVVSYDQSQYFDVEDRQGRPYVFQEVPPNTVFHLGLPKREPEVEAPRPPSPYEVDARVDGHVRTGRRSFASAPSTTADQRRAALEQWRRYAATRRAQCRAVITAIDRLLADLPQP